MTRRISASVSAMSASRSGEVSTAEDTSDWMAPRQVWPYVMVRYMIPREYQVSCWADRGTSRRGTLSARMPVPRMYNTQAIVLSRFELGEADRVLTLLTPHDGKLKAIAKGVRRPRSRLGGAVEPFAELQLVLARGADVRRHHPASVGHAWLHAARPARVDGHGLVSGRARRACRRGACLRLPGLRAAAPRIPAARRRHGARPRGALVSSSAWPTRWACGRRSSAASNATACSRQDEEFRWVPRSGRRDVRAAHPAAGRAGMPLSLAALKLLRAYRRLDIEALAGLRLPAASRGGGRDGPAPLHPAQSWSAKHAHWHSSTRFALAAHW